MYLQSGRRRSARGLAAGRAMQKVTSRGTPVLVLDVAVVAWRCGEA
jgi:hypothetical protein